MERYECVRELGRGAFGVAVLVRELCGTPAPSASKTGRPATSSQSTPLRVVKQIDLDKMPRTAMTDALTEVDVLRRFSHPHIIEYLAAFLEGTVLHIVMEFADGGDLAGAIRRRKDEHILFSESVAMSVFAQCLLALQHIHQMHVLHRDIKSQNIFVMKAGAVKLGDFGIAKVFEHTASRANTTIGTPGFLAPEVCEKEDYGNKADVWSVGVVLYELLALEQPFQACNIAALVIKIVTADPPPLPADYGEEVRDVVRCALQKQAENRPNAHELLNFVAVRRWVGSRFDLAAHEPRPATGVASSARARAADGRLEEATNIHGETPPVLAISPPQVSLAGPCRADPGVAPPDAPSRAAAAAAAPAAVATDAMLEELRRNKEIARLAKLKVEGEPLGSLLGGGVGTPSASAVDAAATTINSRSPLRHVGSLVAESPPSAAASRPGSAVSADSVDLAADGLSPPPATSSVPRQRSRRATGGGANNDAGRTSSSGSASRPGPRVSIGGGVAVGREDSRPGSRPVSRSLAAGAALGGPEAGRPSGRPASRGNVGSAAIGRVEVGRPGSRGSAIRSSSRSSASLMPGASDRLAANPSIDATDARRGDAAGTRSRPATTMASGNRAPSGVGSASSRPMTGPADTKPGAPGRMLRSSASALHNAGVTSKPPSSCGPSRLREKRSIGNDASTASRYSSPHMKSRCAGSDATGSCTESRRSSSRSIANRRNRSEPNVLQVDQAVVESASGNDDRFAWATKLADAPLDMPLFAREEDTRQDNLSELFNQIAQLSKTPPETCSPPKAVGNATTGVADRTQAPDCTLTTDELTLSWDGAVVCTSTLGDTQALATNLSTGGRRTSDLTLSCATNNP